MSRCSDGKTLPQRILWLVAIRNASIYAIAAMLLPGTSAVASPPAFKVGIEFPTQTPVTPAVEASLKDMGIGYVNYYVNTWQGATEAKPEETNRSVMDMCLRLGLDYSIACHVLDPPDECVRDAAKFAQDSGGKVKFRGVVFDELWHARFLNYYDLADYKTPLSKTKTLGEAYEATLQGYAKLRAKFLALGAPAVTATHVWPVAHHISAKSGFVVCPKICKEFFSPVSLAIGMGAAKQYGAELWADCDLWFWDLIPGHTPEELRSNLLLAYWLGVDLTYIEGSGYNLKPAGNQGTPFTLMNQVSPDNYQLTPHGEVLRWFCRQYLPANPRKWTFRDARPNIAIVRFDDTCFGQRFGGAKDNLLGSENLHSTADTEAWLQIWNVLTFGKTGRDGITCFKTWVAASGYQRPTEQGFTPSYLTRPVQANMHRFFVPLNGAVVYDHTAGYELLKDVPLIFLTGVDVTDATLEAIRKCVKEGAVCAAWGPLASKHGFKDWQSGVKVISEGKGKWVLTDDFGITPVVGEIINLIGRPEEIRYGFTGGQVVLRQKTEDEVTVEVSD